MNDDQHRVAELNFHFAALSSLFYNPVYYTNPLIRRQPNCERMAGETKSGTAELPGSGLRLRSV